MERLINWTSGLLDEIELVYEKAEQADETARDIVQRMEQAALAEARACCPLLRKGGVVLTPEQFDRMDESKREQVIAALGNLGLAGLNTDLKEKKIMVRLSPYIQEFLACAMFNLLNRLEKLDGAINCICPEMILELQAPLGGRKGLMQYEMLIGMFYPWLKVHEVSSNELAAKLPLGGPAEQGEPKPEPKPVQEREKKPQEASGRKKGILERLFGKK